MKKTLFIILIAGLAFPLFSLAGKFTIGASPSMSITNGLIGYWTFDGQDTNWSTGKTFDRSGNGNTGTLTNFNSNTAPVAGKFGQALSFDGINDYVKVADTNALDIGTGNFSISFWHKKVSGTSIITKLDGSLAGPGYGLRWTGTAMIVQIDDGPNGTSAQFNVANPNIWHHYVVTIDKGVTKGISVYLDGSPAPCTGNCTYDLTTVGDISNALSLGFGTRNPENNGTYMGGYLDDVRIYNRILTFGEILRLYTLGRLVFPNTSILLTTVGTSTFTIPPTVTSIFVEAWGGGGKGGGSGGGVGGGGSGGAYAAKTLTVVPGAVYTYYVAKKTTVAITNAENTSFSSAAVLLARGGGNGAAGTGTGGTTPAGSVGDVVYLGGNGGTGVAASYSGGGGGGPEKNGNGYDASGITGAGAKLVFGGSGADGVSSIPSNGVDGNSYGGGGSGAITDGPVKTGGQGAQGLIRITFLKMSNLKYATSTAKIIRP